MARITVDELHRLIAEGQRPAIVDLRSSLVRDQDSHFIPGAVIADFAEVDQWLDRVPMDREVIFYCTCPNEAAAAHVARRLMDLGYRTFAPCSEAWMPGLRPAIKSRVGLPHRPSASTKGPCQAFSAPREGRDRAMPDESTDYTCNAARQMRNARVAQPESNDYRRQVQSSIGCAWLSNHLFIEQRSNHEQQVLTGEKHRAGRCACGGRLRYRRTPTIAAWLASAAIRMQPSLLSPPTRRLRRGARPIRTASRSVSSRHCRPRV